MMAPASEMPMSQQEAIIEHRLIDCGLLGTGISVKYEADLQSILVFVRPAAKVTADHFECIKKAVGNEIVMFEDRDMNAAYDEHVSEGIRPIVLASVEGTLRQGGLLRGFPERKNFASLDQYARALEGGVSPLRTALRFAK